MKWTSWILGLLAAVGVALAYSGGPPDGYAGDPPAMNNCTTCHSSFPVNSGDGTLSLVGLPQTYTPGSTYTFQVTLEDPGQSRWGFELTVIDNNGNQAGVLEAVDNTVQISEGPGNQRDYAKQTSNGTFTGQGSASWTLRWTAPPAGTGPVTFYVAGNAANGNFSTSGDYIYTLSTALVSVAEGDSTPPAQGMHKAPRVYPNPLTTPQGIQVQLPEDVAPPAVVPVRDPAGRLVALLPLNRDGSGHLRGHWTGRDLRNRPLSPGTYWLMVPMGPQRTAATPLIWLP